VEKAWHGRAENADAKGIRRDLSNLDSAGYSRREATAKQLSRNDAGEAFQQLF
jgi:hypothetical protein